MSNGYLVIRLVPASPIDPATFVTYLEDLLLQAMQVTPSPGSPTPTSLTGVAYSSPLIVYQNPGSSDPYLMVVSRPIIKAVAAGGNTLTFETTDGIPGGSYLYSPSDPQNASIFTSSSSSGIQVSDVQATQVTLNTNLTTYVTRGTLASFICKTPVANPWSPSPPPLSFTLKTSGPAPAPSDPTTVLLFPSTDGITVGMTVTSTGSDIPPAGTTVASVINSTSITLSLPMPSAPTAGTPITFTLNPPFLSFSVTITNPSTPTQLTFGSTPGIAFGMMISPQAGVIAPGTTVSEVQWSSTKTIVTLSQALIGSLSTGQSVTFTFPLSSGIVQHVESLPIQVPWFTVNVFIPASVATAILPLNAPPPPPPPPPEYLNIALVANRRTEQIAVNNPFYNVVVSPGDPPTPDQYQALPTSATSLYLTLPPPPGTTPINLSLPSDGSAPPFDGLISAMKQVQQADTTLSGVAIKALWQNTAQCTRLAYEIVWSNQNNLPPLPDPLESLYTIPPATGSSSNSTGSNLEQDRQKFEGTLNSFYSTRNATAERLTKFVVAASAAVYCELRSLCELQSLNATEALLEFPVDPELPTTSATVETEVLLQGLGTPGGINFGVPAAFFYALGANFDKSTTADVRYQTSTGDTVERLLVAINAAVQANVISDTEKFQSSTTAPGINSIQAARRLTALGVTSATSSSPKLTMPSSGPLVELVTAWLAVNASPIPGPGQSYQPTQDDQIWSILGNHLAPPDQQRGYLELVLAALTQGANTSSGTLASQIENMLVTMTANPTVATLKAVTAAQWTTFFNNNPTWLPPFTKPGNPAATSSIASTTGYIATRIRAFIRTVEQFFTVSSVPNPSSPPDVGGPPTFNPPQYDLIAQAVADYPGGPFVFGTTTLTQSQLETAVQTVFSAQPDPAAQAWLAQAFISINELWQIASNVPNVAPAGMTPIEPSLSFSVMEALFARGFRFAKDITALTPQEFQQALTGTVAYPYANTSTNSLYQAAGGIPPVPAATTEGNGTFQPINSQGRLTNCLPPRSISPIGPAKYLQELLNLSEASTCEDPSAAPASGHTTLGVAVAARRGPLANLLASCANLETPLPLIDIVNECLEYLGATQPPPAGSSQSPPSGTIYNTSADQLAGYALCKKDDCSRADDRACHDPAKIFAALPEYSTPAIPTKENQAVEPLVFNNLKVDFSSCHLPYSQALDVSRTYLRQFRTSRFEEMRTFRKCITEFVLDPTSPPAGFQSYLRRYPVRIGTAIEYLGITREEYTMLFQGTSPQPCGKPVDDNVSQATRAVPTWELYGFASSGGDNTWTNTVVILPEFLSRTCLTYCEFLELWKSGFVTFTSVNRDSDARNAQSFPDCEPCCLANYTIQFVTPKDPAQALGQLAVFILLWRKLKEHCGDGYSFAHLADICQFLALFGSTGAINPEFIRQLAAFQMLRDYFHLPLVDHGDHTTGTTGADRTHLLALWGGIGAKKWKWALGRLLEGVESDARRRYGCQRPHHEAVAHLADNLDALSRLAGFNPQVTTDTWNSRPTCTLRFAEVLAKICGSSFREGELLFLFNAEHPQDSEDPFPLQDPEDALTFPLDLPENDEHHSLWKLREALLAVEVREEEVCEWTWPRLVAEFRHKFGYAPASGQDPLLSIGQHFFPHVLEASGFSVSLTQRQYRASLAGSTALWNSPPGSPFQYDTSVSPAQLWIQVPLFDEAVIAKLSQMPALTAAEQVAVQDLYFMPRADLAFVAFLFPDWQSAEKHLIEECDGANRWAYFRRHFALANARRKVIVEHLANHVAHVTGCRHEELEGVAALVLSRLFSDENAATTPWESDTGATPAVTWSPLPSGGAIAALLGLVGTGLVGEYSIAQPQQQPATNPPAGQTAPQQQQNPGTAPPAGQTTPQQQQQPVTTPPAGQTAPQQQQKAGTAAAPGQTATAVEVVWCDVRAPLEAFGHPCNLANSPVPTVLPALNLSLPANQLQFVTLHDGYAVRNSDGLRLGGAEAFQVRWSGVLLVECEGEYEFHAGAPTPEGEKPDFERAEKSSWRVTLERGQRKWVVLSHQWPGDTGHERSASRLRRGAYQIVVEFQQPPPDFTVESHVYPQHTGFQVKYAGPDSNGCLVALPVEHLYRDLQNQTLASGITFLPNSTYAQAFLSTFYTSTLRDMRCTYQRLLKAVLFAGRLRLCARPLAEDHQSELGYMLANPANFAGYASYRNGSTFLPHLANFDFNFLPLEDNFHAPTPLQDDRTQPSLQRTQAMSDWWERIFDYDRARKEVYDRCKLHLWLLFDGAKADPTADPAPLLRHMGADPRHWNLDLRYYQDQFNPIYPVTSVDLEDDRWVVRAWHAEQWIRGLTHCFETKDITKARPDLWASADPSALVSGETETGNANLSAFLWDGCLENGEPRRYADLKRLNDELREHGRDALLHYLCRMKRVVLPWGSGHHATDPRQLSDLLLIDVETGICEKASRIEEAITAVQNFIRRARLHLEPSWKITLEFARLWDRHFETFRIWEQCRRRELYRENWIEWTELEKARRVESFRFLESELRSASLTIAKPGGLEWWAGLRPRPQGALLPIQSREPSRIYQLPTTPAPPTPEGFGILGTPESDGHPSWLAAVPDGGTAVTTDARSSAGPKATPKDDVATAGLPADLPFWLEAAIRLGTQFIRVAAAGPPLASAEFVPHHERAHGACCAECGRVHPPTVDEYYFWLVDAWLFSPPSPSSTGSGGTSDDTGSYQFGIQDAYYDDVQQQSVHWNDPTKVPGLLAWQPNPAVRLAWCRIHNCEFGQARSSDECLELSSTPAELQYLGRAGDSLFFAVQGGQGPAKGVTPDLSLPGFRYDLPADRAVTLPLLTKLPAQTTLFAGQLHAYPYFAYEAPGARLYPDSWFAPAIVVGDALKARCCFEAALEWYARAFHPLECDCTWMICPEDASAAPSAPAGPSATTTATTPAQGAPTAPAGTATSVPGSRDDTSGQTNCCDSTKVTDEVVRHREITLRYCETLLDWGDALMRRRHSPEAFQQARLIYDTVAKITGRRPHAVLLPEPASPQPVASFTPAMPPLNPRLMDLYERVADRLGLIHHCLDARRLRNGRPDCDMPYFGDDPVRHGWRTALDPCADLTEWCHWRSPYRFEFLIQKAKELAGGLRELGASLLAAFEKGDAGYLASMRAAHERELLSLALATRQEQYRDADFQIQALQQTKEMNQANLIYYTNLNQYGLINDEIQGQNLDTTAMLTRTGASTVEAIGESLKIIPDLFVGFPCNDAQVPAGTKLAGLFETIGRVVSIFADIQSSIAAIDLTVAGWDRRAAEWVHQTQTLPIEIEQIELQILSAYRRRDVALRELNIQQRQIEQSSEVQDFLRDQFTADDLYLWLQKETMALYFKTYELATFAARQAERAFNFERGHTTRRFIPEEIWDNLHEGLIAGERLEFAVRRMEHAYCDENRREYEIIKNFSLRLHFPMAYLQLRTTGYCEIETAEWMFDLDKPGLYMRRIKSVTLTIPCVTGPFTSVNCRLTLLSSTTRIDPRLSPPAAHCCCDGRQRSDYECCLDDPRIVKQYAATEAIVTSRAQNDSGLFELNLRDERRLPFEFDGAIGRWRIELPIQNNFFDLDTLSDLILTLNYTAWEGGEMLRKVANESAQRHLPGDGLAFFDVRYEFPDAWELFRDSLEGRKPARELRLRISRKLFPYVPGHKDLFITGVALLFETEEDNRDCCWEGGVPARHVVELMSQHGDKGHAEHGCESKATEIACVASAEWPNLYHGVIETRLGPLGRNGNPHFLTFRFPLGIGEISRAFLFCRYEVTCSKR